VCNKFERKYKINKNNLNLFNMGLKASTCKYGNIYIELYQNACAYESGKTIYGMIHVR